MPQSDLTRCWPWSHCWVWLPAYPDRLYQRKRCKRCGREKLRLM
jgi:hypothetical protein